MVARRSELREAEAAVRAERLMTTGVDLKQRKMIVGIPYMEHNTDSDIQFPLAANFFTGLHVLEHMYVPAAGVPVRDHIEIEFVSYGGDLATSFGIFDRIVMVSVPVHIYVYGPCQSGGSLILQAATKRFVSMHSALMLHYGSTSDEGNSDPNRLEEWVRFHKLQMDMLVGIYLSRCNKKVLSERRLRDKILRIETYIDAQTAVRYGLADEIISPKLPE